MKLSYYEKGPKKGEFNLDETLLSMSRYERWVVKPEQTGSFLYAVSDAAKEQPEAANLVERVFAKTITYHLIKAIRLLFSLRSLKMLMEVRSSNN